MAQKLNWSQSSARRHYADGREIMLYGQPDNRFDGTTTHKADYHPHHLEPRPPVPPAYQGSSLPFDGTSTYKSEFVPHPLPTRDNSGVTHYQPAQTPFDGTTTYGSNFVPHPLEKASPRAPAYAPSSLPFEGTSSYKSDYHPHPLSKHEAAPMQYQPRHIPFEGMSSYKGDFVPHPLEARPPAGPNYSPASLPFEGTTTYGDNFRPYPIQAPPPGRLMEYHGSGAKFEGVTENMDKYRAWAINPENYQNRAPPPMLASLPFDGTTTNREMFKGWQLPPHRPALGVQVLGNLAYVLIPADSSIPACGRQIFTTVHDNQTEMDVLILEGDFSQAALCNVLGQMTISGLAPAPKGAAKLEIVMHVDSNGVLNVTAHEQCSKRQEHWLKEGYLTAHMVHE